MSEVEAAVQPDASGAPQPVEVGMIHGRFQPFHNGHLAYALGAYARCRSLIVGITNPDPTHVRPTPVNHHRSKPAANPFPFWLRERMVRGALLEAGVAGEHLAIVPFPIHEPELWHFYVPAGAVHFVRVFSEWEQRKVADLQAAGHEVQVLDEGMPKRETATEVRRLLRQCGGWQDFVPAATAATLREYLTVAGIP